MIEAIIEAYQEWMEQQPRFMPVEPLATHVAKFTQWYIEQCNQEEDDDYLEA